MRKMINMTEYIEDITREDLEHVAVIMNKLMPQTTGYTFTGIEKYLPGDRSMAFTAVKQDVETTFYLALEYVRDHFGDLSEEDFEDVLE